MIIAATLITVATIESLMINRENDRLRLNAIRLAIKDEMLISWQVKKLTSWLVYKVDKLTGVIFPGSLSTD